MSMRDAPRYIPGPAAEQVSARYGLPLHRIIKLSSNENPLGPSPVAARAIHESATHAHEYPDSTAAGLREAIACYVGRTPAHVATGAGSSELMGFVIRACSEPGERILVMEPGFGLYREMAVVEGRGVDIVALDARGLCTAEVVRRTVKGDTRIIFLTRPNNPTSSLVPVEVVADLARALPETIIVSDEAYIEFADRFPKVSAAALVDALPNVIVTRTFSKAFGLASLRLGYAVGSPALIERIAGLKPKWNVGGLAQRAGIAALGDAEHLARTRATVAAGRRQLGWGLSEIAGFRSPIPDPQGNFLYVDIRGTGRRAPEIVEALARRGIMVRGDFSPEHLRISVGLPEHNDALLGALRDCLA